MTEQEKSDLEVLLRRTAWSILVSYDLYIDENNNPSFGDQSEDGNDRQDYDSNIRSLVELIDDMVWLKCRLHPNNSDRPIIDAWTRQFELWSKE